MAHWDAHFHHEDGWDSEASRRWSDAEMDVIVPRLREEIKELARLQVDHRWG